MVHPWLTQSLQSSLQRSQSRNLTRELSCSVTLVLLSYILKYAESAVKSKCRSQGAHAKHERAVKGLLIIFVSIGYFRNIKIFPLPEKPTTRS